MSETLPRRKSPNVMFMTNTSDSLPCSFSLNSKDEIERLRKDFAHTQRSVAVAPPVQKAVKHPDVDYVRRNLPSIRLNLHWISLSLSFYRKIYRMM